MKKTIRCPSCEQRIGVTVTDTFNAESLIGPIVVFGLCVVVPLAFAAMVIWGSK